MPGHPVLRARHSGGGQCLDWSQGGRPAQRGVVPGEVECCSCCSPEGPCEEKWPQDPGAPGQPLESSVESHWPEAPPALPGQWQKSPEVQTSRSWLEMESMKHLLKDSQREKPGPQPAPEHRMPSPLPSPTAVWGQLGVQSSSRQRLQTQDWVCEPPQRSRRPGRHWSLSIDERRRRATMGAPERRGAAGGSGHCLDVAQIVAQLVSQDVDKDILIPHPRGSFQSTHAVLAQSVPFWQNSTLEAQVSNWSPS